MHNKSHTLRRLLLITIFVFSLSGAFTLGTVTGMTSGPPARPTSRMIRHLLGSLGPG